MGTYVMGICGSEYVQVILENKQPSFSAYNGKGRGAQCKVRPGQLTPTCKVSTQLSECLKLHQISYSVGYILSTLHILEFNVV